MLHASGTIATIGPDAVEVGVGSDLFRREVVEARKQDWLGSVHLSTTRMAWPMAGLACAALLVLTLVLTLGSYTRKERVQGQLHPSTGLHTVAVDASGTLQRRLVAEGERVVKGQPLLEISTDIHVPQPGGGVAERVSSELERQAGRLRQDLAELATLQAREEALLRERTSSLQRQLASASAELRARQRQAAAARQTLERIAPLRQQRIVSDVQAQQYEDQALNAEAQLELSERGRLDIERQLAEARDELDALPLRTNERRSEIERALAGVSQELARNQAQHTVLVRASGSGTVSGLAVDEGQAVSPGQRLLSIVPEGAVLHAELWVPSRAIGTLRPDGRVAMRLDAFPYQVFGQQYGRIAEIGGSALSPEEVRARSGIDPGGPVFRVMVALDRQHVPARGGNLALRPHMGLEADLLLERRRLYRLMLEPFENIGQRPQSDSGAEARAQ